jgi:PAS domain S-box-containing protein
MGLSADQASNWGWTAAVHPEDMNGLAATWQRIIASEAPGETEARLRRHDGEYRWFLFRTNPLHDETGSIVKWYGVNTDIEDRKRAEDALRASALNLRQMTETIPEMLWSAAPNGAIE